MICRPSPGLAQFFLAGGTTTIPQFFFGFCGILFESVVLLDYLRGMNTNLLFPAMELPNVSMPTVKTDFFAGEKINPALFQEVDFKGFGKSRIQKAKMVKEIPNRNIKTKYAADLAKELVGNIKLNTQRRVLLSGAFVFCDFICELIKQNDWHITTMTISTLGMNFENVDALHELLAEGWLDELNLIISDGFYNRDYYTKVQYLYKMLDIEDMTQIAVAGNHTKDCIFEIEGGGHICIEGSANLQSSACIEKIFITESEEDYLWNKDYLDKIISEYKTINKDNNGTERYKGLRVDKLYKAITEQVIAYPTTKDLLQFFKSLPTSGMVELESKKYTPNKKVGSIDALLNKSNGIYLLCDNAKSVLTYEVGIIKKVVDFLNVIGKQKLSVNFEFDKITVNNIIFS
jgi:hypothetical protein